MKKNKEIAGFLSKIKEHAEKIEGVKKVILYGPYARNEAGKHSDIDILVVVEDTIDTKRVEVEMDDLLFDILLEEKKLVSLIVVKESLFENYKSPLFLNVEEEGVLL
ncbi:MAG: nucleotidyltransferase domain-containing protein [Candidatus Freyarchaeota archaeon]